MEQHFFFSFYYKIWNTVAKEELENQKDSSLEFILC